MAEVSLDAQGAVQGSISGGIRQVAQDRAKADAQDWISGIEQSNLTPRYYRRICVLVLQEMFEVYDFFLVGYLVSVLAPGWHLTYGQSAVMLLSSGVGAIAGSLAGGLLADRVGRKKMIWGGGLIFSLGAAGCAVIPDGAWILFFRRGLWVDRGGDPAESPGRRNDPDPGPPPRLHHPAPP